jgi:Protein of unknown function (DUF3999)
MKLTIALILACIAASAQAQTAPNYAYAWPIVAEGGSAAYQIELPTEVEATLTSADLGDVDVLNAAGESVPTAPYRTPATAAGHTAFPPLYTVVSQKPSSTPSDDGIHLHIERGPDGKLRSLDADITPAPPPRARTGVAANEKAVELPPPADVQTIALDDATQLIVDASALHEPLASLRIDWFQDGYAHIEVSASDDLQTWHTLVHDAVVMRFTQSGNTLQRHEIPLPQAAHGYLLLKRSDPEAPLGDVRVSVVTLGAARQPEQHWLVAEPDAGVSSNADDAQKPEFRFRLPAPLSINAVDLQLADDNSVATATLSYQRMPDGAFSQTVNGFVAFRLRDGDNVLTNDPLRDFTTPRTRELKLGLSNPVSHAPTLKVAYTPNRIVFLAQGAGPFRLVAGSVTAHHADAPVEAALARLRMSGGADWQPALATLGARAEVRGEQALQAPLPPKPSPWQTWLLWGVLVGAAAIVGGLALSLLRKH